MSDRLAHSRTEDLKLLRKIIAWADEQEDVDESRVDVEAFRGMLVRLEAQPFGTLSEKQRRWAHGTWGRIDNSPVYENLWSAGLVPKGKDVPTPAVLQKLPMKPPTRRAP